MKCPRCSQLMNFINDFYGRYYSCYSCGNHVDVIEGAEPRTPRPITVSLRYLGHSEHLEGRLLTLVYVRAVTSGGHSAAGLAAAPVCPLDYKDGICGLSMVPRDAPVSIGRPSQRIHRYYCRRNHRISLLAPKDRPEKAQQQTSDTGYIGWT